MKLCITSTGNNLESQVDQRFGRCRYFVFYDDGLLEPEIIENTAMNAEHGAGIQASRLVMENRPDAVITGNIGPNASSIFLNAGIKVYSSVGKSVRFAIESYNKRELEELRGPNVSGHFGSGQGKKGV